MRRCLILLLCVAALGGCNKKEDVEETAETYVDTTQCSFDVYDDTFSFTLDNGEHFSTLSGTSATVVTDSNETVTVDYIEGNSLNDFEKAYKNASGDEECLFLKSASNDYLMFKYGDNSKALAESIIQRVAVKEKKS